jgi:hypothetical protein
VKQVRLRESEGDWLVQSIGARLRVYGGCEQDGTLLRRPGTVGAASRGSTCFTRAREGAIDLRSVITAVDTVSVACEVRVSIGKAARTGGRIDRPSSRSHKERN